VHRVGVPLSYSEGGVGLVPDRYSIPFFAKANMDTVVEALSGCWGEENPKKYESMTAWGYVQMRMAALYEGRCAG
jgi:isopenicillin N synthase-like dioxygenase